MLCLCIVILTLQDLPMTEEGDIRRITRFQKWTGFYQFQHIYLLVLYSLLAFKSRVQDVVGTYPRYLTTSPHTGVSTHLSVARCRCLDRHEWTYPRESDRLLRAHLSSDVQAFLGLMAYPAAARVLEGTRAIRSFIAVKRASGPYRRISPFDNSADIARVLW